MPWLATAPVLLRKARFTDDAPSDDFWRILHRLADGAYVAMVREAMQVLADVGEAMPRDRLAALVAAGDRATLEATLRAAWDDVGHQGLQETVAPRMRALALNAAEATPLAELSVQFNVQDSEALAAIDAYAGAQIMAISETTREAVRGIIRRAFESGTPLTQQIDAISQQVGLTPRQAESVSRYQQGLVEAGEPSGRVQELVQRRIMALKRQRAEAIARTETINAANEGQHQRWEQAVRDGLLDQSRLRRHWIITPDDRLCPVCRQIPGMNPEGVGLMRPFYMPGGTVMHPPAHVQCRCAVSAEVRA